MVLKFNANRPKATCRKTPPAVSPEALALAVRLDAIWRRGIPLYSVEALIAHAESKTA